MKFKSINSLLLFLILLFVQFVPTQPLVISFTILLFMINILRLLKEQIKINKHFIIIIYLLLVYTVYLLRPPYMYFTEAKIETFWLLFGILIVCTVHIAAISFDQIAKMIVISSIIGGGITLISYFTGIGFGGLIAEPYAGTRAVGGFDGPNELATYHVLVISIVFGLLLQKQIQYKMIFVITSIVISCTLIFFTFSRGGLIGLGFVISVYLFLHLKKNIKKFTLIVVPLLMVSFFFYWKFEHILVGKFFEVRRNRSDRDYLTEEVWRIFSEKPIFGWGLGSFDFNTNINNTVPHSDYYLLVVSGGLIALVLFVLFLVHLLAKSILLRNYAVGLFVLSFMVQALTFNHLVRGRVSILFWIAVTVVLMANNYKEMKGVAVEYRSTHIRGREEYKQPHMDRPI